jgi:MFS transporter, DHA1 family, inner membrane transport protein
VKQPAQRLCDPSAAIHREIVSRKLRTSHRQEPSSDAAERPWRRHVTLLIGSGVVAAAQIGKAIIAVPMIVLDLALGLDLAGLIVAAFATLGATMGIGAGFVVGRFGIRRSLIGGMGAIAIGNAVGAGASGELVLLAARIVEGVGFVGVVLAIPSMLAQLVPRDARDFVMAIWTAYMPIGIMLMLFATPLLSLIGWRNFWLASASIAGTCAALLAIYAPALSATARDPDGRFFSDLMTVVRDPACLILAFAFFAYSCQIFSLTFALPLLLTSVHNVSLSAAGLLSALVLAGSAVGHVSSGFLLRAGVPIWCNIVAALAFFALPGVAIYIGTLPPLGVSLIAALVLGVGGLAPGAIYAAAAHAAPVPSAVPTTIGLVQQASNLGQFVGPAALGMWVEHFGWHAAPAILAPAALFGLGSALLLRRFQIIDQGRGSTNNSTTSASTKQPAISR